MSELLAPAGNFEALVAAISCGADAIYLGMTHFGARAYSANFDNDSLKEAITYAHLRNVKIYVTLNTIVFEEELPALYKMIDDLNEAKVDGIIIQDLAVFQYIVSKYPNIEAHCSTQMGIDDMEGVLLFKQLGAKRVVLSREVSIEEAKQIKKITKMPIELFVHGALCVSYSGNCLMSGLIGYRSGNRGRCVGSCRKPYTLVNQTTGEIYPSSYLLSMKDLNTIEHIQELKEIDSLKIEGRMKEPAYVANVVSIYRNALDGKKDPKAVSSLSKTFHRTFTKGYLFHEDKKDITNILRPNNFGVYIGKIIKKEFIGYKIELDSPLYQNDIIRIDHNGEDVNLTVVKLYDEKRNLISSATKSCYIQIKENLAIGDKVYKTKEYSFYQSLAKSYPKEFKRFPIDCIVSAFPGSPLTIHANCEDKQVSFVSSTALDSAKTAPTTQDAFFEQFNRLNDSVYSLNQLEYYADNVYIPAKLINEARRFIVTSLNEERLKRDYPINQIPKPTPISYEITSPFLTVYATTKEQALAAKECGISVIYTEDNTIRRNAVSYPEKKGTLLVGGYGGIYAYTNQNEIVSDFSLNVVNSKSVYQLHALGVNRVT
ncbi:MAG: U32 family peptidase, partial [Anaeroplasmataceae bacterium]|nr:U32 family peptidase [Anaeroplasmataceae bacterium]